MPDESCSMFKTLGFVSIEGLKARALVQFTRLRYVARKNQTHGTYTAPGRDELRDTLPQKI